MELNEFNNILINCEKHLDDNDWKEVEKKLGNTIPSSLKKFYDLCNGGQPKGKLFIGYGKDEIAVKMFMPVKYNHVFHNAPENTMEGMTLIQRSYDTIGSDELIIGIAKGKLNRICVNIKTGSVDLYPLIGLNKAAFIFGEPIHISDSFDQFISMLKYEPEEADNVIYREERTSKDKLQIDLSAEKLCPDDIIEFEKATGFSLPATMKKFYLKNNGGMPNLDFFQPQYGDWDEVEINMFLPIKYQLKGVQPIEETSRTLWDRDMISQSLLPFAIDSGNNLYALHKKSNAIYYVVMDIWNDALSKEENFEENSTKIASSFKYFITHLQPEE